jgi:hypothetical protein
MPIHQISNFELLRELGSQLWFENFQVFSESCASDLQIISSWVYVRAIDDSLFHLAYVMRSDSAGVGENLGYSNRDGDLCKSE